MADPIVAPIAAVAGDLVADSATLDRVFNWSKVLDAPAGKKRFQAIRGLLRDHLQEVSRAPNASKKFLSESLIKTVGPSGSASKLPRELRQMLGSSADDFAKEVQTGYYFLTGKSPASTKGAFNSILNEMKKAGMSADDIGYLKRLGPGELIKRGGPGAAVKALTEAKKDPALLKMINWATRKVTGKAAPTAMPATLEMASQAFKPSPEMYKGLAAQGAKGLGKVARVARGAGILAPLTAAATGYEALSTVSEVGAERQRVAEMERTGIIPESMGGPAVVARTAKGEPITSGQFLQMLQEREDRMKMARFTASTQEGDLTKEVMSYLSGSPEASQRQVRRIQLGSARPAETQQQAPDAVMKQFDSFLRQATAGPLPGE